MIIYNKAKLHSFDIPTKDKRGRPSPTNSHLHRRTGILHKADNYLSCTDDALVLQKLECIDQFPVFFLQCERVRLQQSLLNLG
jgi:hypothetical protein